MIYFLTTGHSMSINSKAAEKLVKRLAIIALALFGAVDDLSLWREATCSITALSSSEAEKLSFCQLLMSYRYRA
jgi:hypothetical protein